MTSAFTPPRSQAVALITGGATGIGFGIARAFAQSGAKVVLASRREDALASAVAQIAAERGEATAVRTDVRNYASRRPSKLRSSATAHLTS